MGDEPAVDDFERLHEVVSENAAFFAPSDEGHMLRGALLISEWMNADGERWITCVSTDSMGKPLMTWDIRGYLSETQNTMDSVGITVDDDDDTDVD
jgi:hypothetical protein